MSIYLVIESYTRVLQSLISVGVVIVECTNREISIAPPHGGTTLWHDILFILFEEGNLSEQNADRPRRRLGSSQ